MIAFGASQTIYLVILIYFPREFFKSAESCIPYVGGDCTGFDVERNSDQKNFILLLVNFAHSGS